MTRLTHTTYRLQHHQLRREWLDRHGFAFTMLSPTEQILIHDFYEPSKSFTDRQLRAHRAAITKLRPSLPHQAGKAFVRIAPFLDAILAPLPVPGRGKPYGVKIASLVNPHLDPDRIARILIQLGLLAAMPNCPQAVTELPTGGQWNCPLVAMGSAHFLF